MDSRDATPTDTETANRIRQIARRLSRRINDPAVGVEDYEQELTLHAELTLVGFDPNRGSRNAFICCRLKQREADIVRAARAKRRRPDRPVVEIDAPHNGNDRGPGCHGDALIDPASTDSDRGHRERDVRDAEASLEQDERQVCVLLRFGLSPHGIAKELGVSSRRFNTIKGGIAAKFRARGLHDYC